MRAGAWVGLRVQGHVRGRSHPPPPCGANDLHACAAVGRCSVVGTRGTTTPNAHRFGEEGGDRAKRARPQPASLVSPAFLAPPPVLPHRRPCRPRCLQGKEAWGIALAYKKCSHPFGVTLCKVGCACAARGYQPALALQHMHSHEMVNATRIKRHAMPPLVGGYPLVWCTWGAGRPAPQRPGAAWVQGP